MKTTPQISPSQATEEPSFGEWLAEFLPYVAAIFVLAPITLLCLMLWAPFLIVLALVVAPAVAIALIGVGAAILATPFVLVHHVEHLIEVRHSRKRAPAISATLRPNVGSAQ